MFHNIKEKFSHKGGIDYIVAGLGNPGSKYEGTRHNIGFSAIDRISQKIGVSPVKVKFEGLSCTCEIEGAKVLFLKPQTFMNNSGRCISQYLNYYKLPPEQLIVIFDDISLAPGKMRIRRSGSDGGHNGIKSIIEYLGSEDFPRIKIGIGQKEHPDMDLADWVLGKFKKEDLKLLPDVLDRCDSAVRLMLSGKLDTAMNQFN